jgi:predicted DNA-binding protein
MHRCYTQNMPTLKQRISLAPDTRLLRTLEKLAKMRGEPVATVSLALIERALELEEDIHFSREADERLANDEPRVDHRQAWK